jgi:hypothetical protein
LTQWGWDCLWYCVPGRPWHFAAHVRSLSPKACCAHYYVLNIMGHLGHAAFPLNYQASLWHLSTGCTMETPWACLQDFAFIVSTCSLAHWVSGLSVWTECLEWVSGLECLDLSVWRVSGLECLDFGCLWMSLVLDWSWMSLVFGCLWRSVDVSGLECLDFGLECLESVLKVSGVSVWTWVSGLSVWSVLSVWTECLDWVSGLSVWTELAHSHLLTSLTLFPLFLTSLLV